MGDIANTKSEKTCSLEAIYIMVRTMSQMSTRDNVALTERESEIPAYQHRIVLAADLPMEQSSYADNSGLRFSKLITNSTALQF